MTGARACFRLRGGRRRAKISALGANNKALASSDAFRMYEPVPASELDAVFAETFGSALTGHGFEQMDPRRWVRSAKQPIRELFCVLAMKGACFSPCWGFSLDFVPHVSGSSVRWHRSAKAALFDLCYDPVDYTTNAGEWFVPSLWGRSVARKEAARVTREALESALPWFASVNTLADLVREFEAKRQRPFVRFGFDNYVQEPLAYAFILARVGRWADAEAEIIRYLEGGQLREPIRNRLLQLLREQEGNAA